jgi:hypothetical protein
MKSISFSVDENKVINNSAWLFSLIQFANKISFYYAFKNFDLKMKKVAYLNLNRIQILVSFL